MQFGKVKPMATVVAQFPANVELDVILYEGKIFMPVMNCSDILTDVQPDKKREPSFPDSLEKSEKAASAAAKGAKSEAKVYTEEELMDMETSELISLAASLGIDPSKTPGKNTNKKVRSLILEAQEEGTVAEEPAEAPAADDAEEDDAPAEEGSELLAKVGEILEDFDSGKMRRAKVITSLQALGTDGADMNSVEKYVIAFEEDTEASIDDIAAKITAALSGVKASSKKKPARSAKKEEKLIDADDLEVGMKISVYWADENKDWFDGEVKSIKKGKITIAYEDGTEEVYDPAIHTKIKQL